MKRSRVANEFVSFLHVSLYGVSSYGGRVSSYGASELIRLDLSPIGDIMVRDGLVGQSWCVAVWARCGHEPIRRVSLCGEK